MAVLPSFVKDLKIAVQILKTQAYKQLVFYVDILKADFSHCNFAESYPNITHMFLCY